MTLNLTPTDPHDANSIRKLQRGGLFGRRPTACCCPWVYAITAQ